MGEEWGATKKLFYSNSPIGSNINKKKLIRILLRASVDENFQNLRIFFM